MLANPRAPTTEGPAADPMIPNPQNDHGRERPADAFAGASGDVPEALAPVVLGLHHVAIAVPSIADLRPVFEGALGLRAHGGVEHVADQRVDVLVLFGGAQRIELVEPASDDSPITKFLARSGGRAGLHHLAFEVADVADAIRRLRAAGVEMIDEAPRPGSHGTTIAFVHPRSTGGVLMELVEDPASAAGASHP